MKELVLVGCSGKKLAHAAPARELYASNLFQLARAYAESRETLGASWAILSAKHGLVLPDDVLEPYDVSFRRLRASRENVALWSASARIEIDAGFPNHRVIFLAGADYRGAVAHLPSSRLREPLAGLGIGKRLQWLRRQLRASGSSAAPAAGGPKCTATTHPPAAHSSRRTPARISASAN